MDVAPRFAEVSQELCAGEVRGCTVSDEACTRSAELSGLVPFERHRAFFSYCRPEQIRTRPTGVGWAVMVAAVAGIALLVVRWRKRRAAASSPPR